MSSDPNAAQREHWNAVAGPKWVGLGDVMDTHLREIGDLAISRAAPRKNEAVLEIGSGGGPLAVKLAEAVGPDGEVLGIDIAAPMIEAARARVAAAGLRNVTFLQADAQAHALPEAHFDLLFSRFGVMFFADPVAAFRNLRRAARPGGRLCFVCWGPLEKNPHWTIPLGIAARHLGPPDRKPPRAPGPFAFSDSAYVRDVLEQSGFRDVTITEATPAMRGISVEDETRFVTTMGPAGALIAERAPAPQVVRAIQTEIAAAFAPYATKGELAVPALVLVVEGKIAEVS
jgi:SAM-dependent methyltransferase